MGFRLFDTYQPIVQCQGQTCEMLPNVAPILVVTSHYAISILESAGSAFDRGHSQKREGSPLEWDKPVNQPGFHVSSGYHICLRTPLVCYSLDKT